jgi:tetratricopeptide (TPR) repeat protein
LGLALSAKGDVDGAIRCYRTAIDCDPKLTGAHYNLGLALHGKGDLEGAIRAYRIAIERDPKLTKAHYNLGVALKAQGDLDGAIVAYRSAIECDPKFAPAHYNLGNALQAKGDVDGAIPCYRTAIECDPKLALAHCNLGTALKRQGDLDGAITAYRRAIALAPKFAEAHTNLGTALYAKGDVAGAIRCFRTAITCDPKYAKAHGALGQALLKQGHFAEARKEARRALDLLLPQDPLRNLASRLLKQSEQLLALDEKLPAILKGDARPAGATERLAIGFLCYQYKQLYGASARFYADAFAEQPKLGDNPRTQARYNAACAAALAAAGHGKDADKLDNKERTRLRKQALEWLRAELPMWGKLLEKATPQQRTVVQTILTRWKKGRELATVRNEDALALLPEAEREAWQKLWADVDALLAKARPAK